MNAPLTKTQLPNLLVDAENSYHIVPNGLLSEFNQCQTTGDETQTVNSDGYFIRSHKPWSLDVPKHFRSFDDFDEFCFQVTHGRRHVLSAAAMSFLDALFDATADRRRILKKGTRVWRAQHGHGPIRETPESPWGEPLPYPPERMKPLPHSASEGRANVKGIPCLYVATDRETAMAEVRPWVGTALSVAELEVRKDLTLVDFSVGHDAGFVDLWIETDESQIDENILLNIDRAFSTPITATTTTAEYAPTQIIAEFFKTKGIDGLVYKSSLGSGSNIALFRRSYAAVLSCSIVRARSVMFDFGEPENTYVVGEEES